MSKELSDKEYLRICDEIYRLMDVYRSNDFAVEALENIRLWCEEENIEDEQEKFYDMF